MPKVRSAGHDVIALSVAPEKGTGNVIAARIKAQDEQDKLVASLGVPFGLAPDALSKRVDIKSIIGEEEALAGTRIAKEVAGAGKRIVHVSSSPSDSAPCELLAALKAWG